MKILPLAEAKAKLSQPVAEVSRTDDEFESWKESTAVLSDPELRDQILEGVKALRGRRTKTLRGKESDRLFRDPR
jgi:PHD/YefM family antitoxin component YafN of YafNO toxin-antitoxin module